MTIPSSARGLGGRLPSAKERATANQLRGIIARQQQGDRKISVVDDAGKSAEVILTPEISSLLIELLRHIGKGDAVTLVPVSQMLTTQQAADILNVSRPYLISLLEKKELDHSYVGRHRRIKAEDLFNYKETRNQNRAKALSDLADLDADFI